MNAQTRNANLLLAAVLLAGGAAYGISGMEPDDSRTLAYTGYLENGSAPQSGTFQLRFGLFASENADDSCLLTGPTDCTLWSEEQSDVQLDSGVFSVVLGEATALSDTVLAQTSLYLGIAVQGPADAAFTVVGKQKLQMVPFAARAAAAKDYKVTGDLTVGGLADVGTLDVDGVSNLNGRVNVEGGVLFDCPTCGGSTLGGGANWGDLTIQGRVLSSDSNLHLSPPAGRNVVINDDYRAAGGAGDGAPGLIVEGETQTGALSVLGEVDVLRAKTTQSQNNVPAGGSFSGTAATDGFVVYWAYRGTAQGHVRVHGESPSGTTLVYNTSRTEAGDVAVNGMFPVQGGQTWRVRLDNSSNPANLHVHFIPMGQ